MWLPFNLPVSEKRAREIVELVAWKQGWVPSESGDSGLLLTRQRGIIADAVFLELSGEAGETEVSIGGGAQLFGPRPGDWAEFILDCRELAKVEEEAEKPRPDALQDSAHYAYPPEKRLAIVRHFRRARRAGEVLSKDRWARSNYQISGRTLLNYEREFPEET